MIDNRVDDYRVEQVINASPTHVCVPPVIHINFFSKTKKWEEKTPLWRPSGFFRLVGLISLVGCSRGGYDTTWYKLKSREIVCRHANRVCCGDFLPDLRGCKLLLMSEIQKVLNVCWTAAVLLMLLRNCLVTSSITPQTMRNDLDGVVFCVVYKLFGIGDVLQNPDKTFLSIFKFFENFLNYWASNLRQV